MLPRSKWPLGALLVMLALFVSSTFSSWIATSTIILVAILVVVVRKDPLNGSTNSDPQLDSAPVQRWITWVLMSMAVGVVFAVTTAWRWGGKVGEHVNPIYVGIDVLAHASVIISLLLWVLYPRKGHVSMLPLGLMVVLLCVAAGGTSDTLAVQTTIALGACTGFVIASKIVLDGGREVDDRAAAGERKTSWVAPLFSLLTLSVILMTTSAIAKVTNDVLPSVKSNLHDQLKSTLDALGEESFIGGTGYVQGSKLGSVRRHMLDNPDEIALQVRCDSAAGYLRGNVFDSFRQWSWSEANNASLPPQLRTGTLADRLVARSGPGTVPLKSSSGGGLARFALQPASGEQIATMEIRNDPLKGTTVFTPLATRWIEASSSELGVSRHGIVRVGVDVRRPYVAGVASKPAPQTLDERHRKILVSVPAETGAAVSQTARQICASETTTRGKAAAISNYFQSQFLYSLIGTRPPRGVDPITHFLETKHPAHCEYFASATALLLRSEGIPTRYVTGYVASEYVADDKLWVARNRDAHAWVEAYDDANGEWFAVESTPGRTYQTINASGDHLDANGDSLGDADSSDGESDTLIGWIWGWLRSTRATEPLMIVFRIAQLPLFIVLLFVLWTRLRGGQRGQVDPADAQCLRMLRQVDRLSRKRDLVRPLHETLHQFAERIDGSRSGQSAVDRQLGDLARWYRHYAESRYDGKSPVPFAR